MLAVTFAATMEYIKSPEGVQYVGEMLQFEIEQGRKDKTYVVLDGFGREYRTKPESIVFVKAALVNGVPTSCRQILSREITENHCELCGTKSYCVKLVKDRITRDEVLACNHCLVHNELSYLRDEADSGMCMNCPIVECPYHPMKEIMRGMA